MRCSTTEISPWGNEKVEEIELNHLLFIQINNPRHKWTLSEMISSLIWKKLWKLYTFLCVLDLILSRNKDVLHFHKIFLFVRKGSFFQNLSYFYFMRENKKFGKYFLNVLEDENILPIVPIMDILSNSHIHVSSSFYTFTLLLSVSVLSSFLFVFSI
jgi:hypothetical protein